MMSLGTPEPKKLNATISAGIHGDEPAGVEAVIEFLSANVANEHLLSQFYFTIFPCDNPSGWELGTRENAVGIDLNREFAARHPSTEVALIMKALDGRCFDLVIEMHEDIDAPGFYMYELVNDPSKHVGEQIIQAVISAGYPVDERECIEGMQAFGGLIRPKKSRRFRKTHLPKAVYTYRTCGGHVITLEPPASMLPLEDRVKIELMGMSIALDAAKKSKIDNRQE
jgi:hypothetical protein